MKQLILPLISLLPFYSVNAQDIPTGITGGYYLKGVMETASGFQFNADSTFQFFYSYGALDRFGKGTWKMQNDSTIILNSRQKPPADFKLVDSKHVEDKFITFRIVDKNTNLLNHVLCIIRTSDGEKDLMTDHEGTARFPAADIDSVFLIFEFCPEKYSAFEINKKYNDFAFSFEPWIVEVFFENFILHCNKNILTGKHPLLDNKNYRYVKE